MGLKYDLKRCDWTCNLSELFFLHLYAEKHEQSEFYDPIMPRIKDGKVPDVFATRDEDVHRQMRRPVASA